MKKITLIVQSKDTQAALESLRNLSVVHIEHQNVPAGIEVRKLKDEILCTSEATAALADTQIQRELDRSPTEISETILNLLKEKEVLNENILKRHRSIDQWQEWGDFAPDVIKDLRNRNLFIRLARIPVKTKKQIPAGVIVQTLFQKSGLRYCALISRDKIDVPFEVLELPNMSLSSMLKLQKDDQQRIKDIDGDLIVYAGHKKALADYLEQLRSILQFHEVWAGMGKFETLSYVRGYIPYDSVEILEKAANKEKWGMMIEDPDANDNVPTLIRNPRWVQIIKPVFDLIKALPGYKEVDISLWFLLFFSVFFGILIGDAGYGIIIFILNFFLHMKLKKSIKDTRIFPLIYALSICAIIWGVLTGTFFGQAWLHTRFKPLMPFLSESKNVQTVCFLIGALHLSIAHLWRGLMKFPHLKSLAEIGWICLLWGAFFLARVLILDETFPIFAKWFFIVGATLILFFTNPTKNIFKSVGSGLQEFLLNVVNSFTDVVSYIRLFAVGTATVAVADAFNQMATSAGGSGVIGGAITVLILLFGHTLNILLGAMSILVHGVRLNVLEFSSHLNMEWAGVPYFPFKTKELKEE